MNPVYLSMKAFGSYRDVTELDFTRTQQNLFLITGPTGSGKTTIFDAIVFALYGEVSASDGKKDSMLQSEFAPKGTKPEVIFRFSRSLAECGQVYTVRRTPRYLKKKGKNTAKGGAFTVGNPELEVIRPDGTRILGRAAEIQQELNDIVGLTKEQFTQVVMIAQGEFMKVIRESTAKKTEIFRKLFHTEIYNMITDELARRKSLQQTVLEETRGECGAAIERIRYPEEPGVICTTDPSVSEPAILTAVDVEKEIRRLAEGAEYPSCISLLEELCRRMEDRLVLLEERCRKEMEKEKETAKCYVKAEELLKNIVIYETASEKLKQLSEKDGEYEAKEKLLRRLEEAFPLFLLKEARDYEQERLAGNQRSLAQEREKTAVLEEERERAKEARAEKERFWEQAQKEYQETEIKVRGFRTAWENLTVHRQAFAREEEICQKSGQKLERLLAEIEKDAETMRMWEQTREEKKDAGIHMAEAERKVSDKERLKQQLDTAKEDWKTLKNSRKEEEKACRAYMDAKEVYLGASKTAERLELAFLDSQAGLLARSLKDGQACKVCGSKEHPKPAVWNAETDVSQQDVEDARTEREKQREALEEKNRIFVRRQQDCETGEKELARKILELAKELHAGEEAALTSDFFEGALRKLEMFWSEKEEEAFMNRQAAEKEQKELKEAERNLIRLQETAEDNEKKKVDLEKIVIHAKEAMAAENARIGELAPQMLYGSREEGEAALQKAKNRADQARKAYEEADQARSRAENQAAENRSRIRSLEQEMVRGREDARRKETAYREALDRQRLIGEEEIEVLAGTYSREDAEQIRKEIEERNHLRQKLKGSIEAAQKAANGQEKPDMELLRSRKEEAEKLALAARRQYDTLLHIVEQDRSEVEKLKAAYGKRADAYRRFRKVERLYHIASGARGQKNRISLETYVQRAYLKQVLAAANRRFQKMTAGAYHLELIEIEDTGAQSQRGLDLAVRSAFSDRVRDISTLSGGESFMAALSMALGMADQIKISNGAVHLDMMFIDEGFGSLDDHTRNQAVAILKEVAGKDRKTGVISHVSELKQSIDDRIIVTKDESGSHARWERDRKQGR